MHAGGRNGVIGMKRVLSAMALTTTTLVLVVASMTAATGAAGPSTQDRSRWLQLAAGDAFSCGIRTDHTLWCWGRNSDGQLGSGSQNGRVVPARVGADDTWVQVAVGYTHACAIKRDGTLWCWGDNVAGQLGNGETKTRTTPVLVRHPTGWSAVSAGDGFTCAVGETGSLWCWGADALGQLGNGGPGRNETRPERIGGATTWSSLSLGLKWGCGLHTDGTAWCWGDGAGGVLGNGSQRSSYRPTSVRGGGTWSTLSAGDNTTCGVSASTAGSLWCWGSNDHGALGIGGHGGKRLVPAQVGTWRDWTTVSAAGSSACGVRSTGTLWCWGDDHDGQLGFRHQRPVQLPTRVGSTATWTQVSVGQVHTLGIHRALGGWAWGANHDGELGDGTTTQRFHPVRIDTADALPL